MNKYLKRFLHLFIPKPRPPYRGICPQCQEKVYHHYPWWDKNPLIYQDAHPFHDKCHKDYLHDCDSSDENNGIPYRKQLQYHGEITNIQPKLTIERVEPINGYIVIFCDHHCFFIIGVDYDYRNGLSCGIMQSSFMSLIPSEDAFNHGLITKEEKDQWDKVVDQNKYPNFGEKRLQEIEDDMVRISGVYDFIE